MLSLVLAGLWYHQNSRSWSPRVLGTTQIKDYLVNDYIIYASDQDSQLNLYWMDREDGEKDLLADKALDYAPAFMFGFKEVIFFSRQSGFTEIWRYDTSTGRYDLITATTSYPLYHKISPNGKKMVYLEYNKASEDEVSVFGPIYLVDLVSGRTQLINNNASFPEWDSDSKFIIYSAKSEPDLGDYKICLRDLNQQGTLGEEQDIYQGGISPLYFSSKQEIIFTKLDSETIEIAKMNLYSQEATVITDFEFSKEEGLVMNYQLSPDQTRLLFTRTMLGGDNYEEIWVVGINGRNPKKLVKYGHAPVWSRVDNKIIYTKSGYQEDIWVMDVTGLNQVKLTSQGNNWFPATTISMSSNPGILIKNNFDNFYSRYGFD